MKTYRGIEIKYEHQCGCCEGTGEEEITCETCLGEGEEECYECNGDGFVFDDTDEDSKVQCGECDGNGYATCGECDGDGHVGVSCQACDGTGIDPLYIGEYTV